MQCLKVIKTTTTNETTEHLPNPRRSALLEFRRARPKITWSNTEHIQHAQDQKSALKWVVYIIAQICMPIKASLTSWTLLNLRTLLSWGNKCGDGFKLWESWKEKGKYPWPVQISVLGNAWLELCLERGTRLPSDNAGDCQWRSRELR